MYFVYFVIFFYTINLFFALNLVLNTRYKLSYLIYTLLLLIVFPFLTPIIYIVIFLDERIESIHQINYEPTTISGKQLIFNNGETFFDDLIEEIEQAKEFIIISMFIFNTDQIGKKIIDLLEKKATDGVEVIILYDFFAKKKRSTKMKHFKNLKNHGGKLICFLPLFLNGILNLNYRNHRKTIIIDNSIAYMGGFNIGDEYLSRDKKLGIWSDTELKVTGHVQELTKVINADLALVKKDIQHLIPIQKEEHDPNQQLPLITSGLESNRINNSLYKFIDLIYHAKESIYVMTPYLVLTDGIIDSLVYASVKGVDIKIIIPSKNDHILVNNASRANALKLLNKNIQVYLYSEDAFMHSKLMLIDNKECFVTSTNLDIRSCKYNLELGTIVTNQDTITVIKNQFIDKLKYSKQFTHKDCRVRDKLCLFASFIL